MEANQEWGKPSCLVFLFFQEVLNKFMPFLNNIDQIRGIEWSATYLWDVKLDGAPSPFDSFFPATEVVEVRAELNTHNFPWFMSNFEIPKGTSVKTLKMTFYDNSKNVLFKFFDDWINKTILNNASYVSTIEKAVKSLQLIKLNSRREQMETTTYSVFPKGHLSYTGNSETGARTYSMDFIATGISGSRGLI